MLNLKTFVFNPFQVNTYVLSDSQGEGYIIDAACFDEREKRILTDYLDSNNLKIRALINTHCHVDHVLGIKEIRERYKIPFYCSADEQFLLDTSVTQGEVFGFEVNKPSNPDKYISEEDQFEIGGKKIKIISIPGHSPGSLSFYIEEDKMLFSGDALFAGSIGRTDLPGGDHQKLVNGIKTKLLMLNKDVEVYPGHGPSTTIENEILTNPFLQ
jgi:glyoxylase-like metal-dependent hydrolase (beta-lactamase superfamily II)